MRRKSREIKIGKVKIGADNPISVQSMTTTDTRNVEKTAAQVRKLTQAGCEIVRLAVVDQEAAQAIARIKKQTGTTPLVADIHFDYRLALASIKAGVDGLRINPGNIGNVNKIAEVVRACRDCGVPIRIGVNAGSLEKGLLKKYGGVNARAMVESVMNHVKILEDMDFRDIKISLKASSALLTIEAYRMIARMLDYPLHLGVTEAGTTERALIKSSIGIGMLLNEGIGDTIRVSLTSDPVDEVWAGYEILRALGLRQRGPELVSCPTCGRCEIDLIKTAEEVDKYLRQVNKPIKVAVMGCIVNGPGEAREADVGIAGGRGFGLLLKKGEIIKKVPEEDLVKELLREIDKL